MNDRKKAMLMASFTADSLALGVHWIYDTQQIANTYGRVEKLMNPAPGSFHPTKNKGDFTHYADQTFVLLQSLADCGAFDLADFSAKWRALFADYTGYADGATRKTLAWYAKGKTAENAGSRTGDFSGAARIAPILFLYADDEEKALAAARAQTAMTHNDPNTVDTAEFFTRVILQILRGTAPAAAIETIVRTDAFAMSPIAMWVEEGLKSRGEDSVKTISRFGQACETQQVFPGVIHLIASYEKDLKEALVQCMMAGGDNAARGSMTGMVLGAWLGTDAIPPEWSEGLNKQKEIEKLLDKIS
ncbi:MAG: ADP-ribosylglycohydrolase family protein [Desulfococcaceae bacterium]|nr:ADP-ribosylglycohydrolase family protein [Desulfococcaceae bacterium]